MRSPPSSSIRYAPKAAPAEKTTTPAVVSSRMGRRRARLVPVFAPACALLFPEAEGVRRRSGDGVPARRLRLPGGPGATAAMPRDARGDRPDTDGTVPDPHARAGWRPLGHLGRVAAARALRRGRPARGDRAGRLSVAAPDTVLSVACALLHWRVPAIPRDNRPTGHAQGG